MGMIQEEFLDESLLWGLL